ncbi:MAG: hypothetical protein KJ072_21955 [Verrucomicrobia bacterium]|nr:hypothetical protein [Verrucomicrobiota bacterium]
MKNDTARRLTACLLAAVALTPGFRLLAVPPDPAPLRGLEEVSHAQVELHGGFWGPRLKGQHDVTVPHALKSLEKDGHVTNFDKAAGKFDGPLKGHHAFDSDLRAEHRAGMLGGVTVLAGRGTDDKQNQIALTAVPYYAWQNREKGAMNVWIPEAPIR